MLGRAGGGLLGLGLGGGGQVRMLTCGGYVKEMRAGNLARHQRGACRVWDPRGGQTPDGGRRPKWMVLREASWVAASKRRKRERLGMPPMHQTPPRPRWRLMQCPRCSRPGDLLKQQGGKSTLGFPPGGDGG